MLQVEPVDSMAFASFAVLALLAVLALSLFAATLISIAPLLIPISIPFWQSVSQTSLGKLPFSLVFASPLVLPVFIHFLLFNGALI